MDESKRKRLSKYLSLILRHRPDLIGVRLDPRGWVKITDLITAMRANGRTVDRVQLLEVVKQNAKQRFAISEDGQQIRANQGHSVDVELDYSPSEPPAVLYHGTVETVLGQIFASGLKKMKRHHVHLSPDVETARVVGSRRGRPIVLKVDARAMFEAGHVFYVSTNGVWLTEAVAPDYLTQMVK